MEEILKNVKILIEDDYLKNQQEELLREQNSLLRALLEKDTGVYLDGRTLSNSVDKYKHEQGRVLIVGGTL